MQKQTEKARGTIDENRLFRLFYVANIPFDLARGNLFQLLTKTIAKSFRGRGILDNSDASKSEAHGHDESLPQWPRNEMPRESSERGSKVECPFPCQQIQ